MNTSEEMDQYYKAVQHGNDVTDFKQVDNRASKHVLGKKVLSRYHKSHIERKFVCSSIGTIFAFHLETKGFSTTSYKGLMRPILMNAAVNN